MKSEELLKDLNPDQIKGVIETEGPVLVLAGAGSGKTRLLTYKLAYLVKVLGIPAYSIFATTFTNKAAGEMKARAERLVGGALKGMWIGTFHSLCGRILRIEAEALGLTPEFTIYDEDDSLRLVKQIMRELKLDNFKVSPRGVASYISSLKEKLITPEEFNAIAMKGFESEIVPVYKEYQAALQRSNAVDFDDMIMYVVYLFRQNEEIHHRWASRFQYILVDEFQDTNRAQYELVKLLSAVHRNVTVVGDDDQSIYGWRGAEIRNILNFPNDFQGTKIVKLEQNYRSTRRILEVANAIVKNNSMRHEKRLWCNSEDGSLPTLNIYQNEYEEGSGIVKIISRLINDNGVSPNNIAILYRTNAQSRIFEEELRRANIPYQVVGGISFYQRSEIKDMLAYLKLIVNPKDNLSFARIVNLPPRGVGKSSIQKLEKESASRGIPIFTLCREGQLDFLPRLAQSGIKNFVSLIEELKGKKDDVYVLLKELVEKTGYIKMLEEEAEPESEERIENIYELLSSAYAFSESHPEDRSVEGYLAEVSLLTSVDQWDPNSGRVSLMTVHSAKGLEFEYVFVAGLEHGLFPLAKAEFDNELLEEERRLFYVATTRCKRGLWYSYALTRRMHGNENFCKASQFLEEIPKELLNVEGGSCDFALQYERDADFPISVNSRVLHPFFGFGRVLEIRGRGKNAIVTVLFEKFGIKKLALAFTELEIV